MSLIRKFLCKIGFHWSEEDYVSPHDREMVLYIARFRHVRVTCVRCGKKGDRYVG